MRGTGPVRPRVFSRNRVVDVQEGFGGGLNTRASDDSLNAQQVRTATNAILNTWGDATKRLGTRRLHSAAIAAAPLRNGVCWRTASTHEYLVACNSRLFSGGTYSTAMTWTDKGAIAAGYPTFAAFRDASAESLYIADGTLRKYTGGALSAPAGATGVSVLAMYNQRLFGITGNDQTVYYSALNDGDTLGNAGSGGGSAIVRTFSAQKLTGLLTLKNSLALFHVNGISQFTGYTQDDIAIAAGTQGLSTDVGTIAPRSIIAVDGIGYFMSERGVYAVSDAGVIQLDSFQTPDPTAPLLARLSATNFLLIDATYDRVTETIRWWIPGLGVYVYHRHLKAWAGPWTGGYTDITTHCLFDGIDGDGAPITLMGSDNGFLLHCDYPALYKDHVASNGTGGDAYTLRLQMRRMFTNHPEADKAWRWAYVFADLRGSITASMAWSTSTGSGNYTFPPGSSASIWGEFDWGSELWGGSGSLSYRIPLSHRGTFIDFVISDDGDAASVYSRITLEGFDYGRRG